jgi:hypothetical protein
MQSVQFFISKIESTHVPYKMSLPADIKTQFLEFYNAHDIENLRYMLHDLPACVMNNLWTWTTFEYVDFIYLIHDVWHLEWNEILQLGCYYNFPKFIDVAVDNGANNWAVATISACGGGRMDMINLTVSCAGDRNQPIPWAHCLLNAINCKQLHIVEWIIDTHSVSITDAMITAACRGGNIDIANVIFRTCNIASTDWNIAMQIACKGGSVDVVKLAIHYGTTIGTTFTWNDGLWMHCELYSPSCYDIICLMLQCGATEVSYLKPDSIEMLFARGIDEVCFNRLERNGTQALAELCAQIRATRASQQGMLEAYLPKVVAALSLDYVVYHN